MAPSPSDLPLHLIGTKAFLPVLLAYIRNLANPTSLPLDHVIFQSILLCLIAGDKHLILRAPEEDVGLTVKLVVWTLSCVFGLSTHKLKIRNKSSSSSRSGSRNNNHHKYISPATDPTTFLRSLFLQSASSSNTSQDEGSGDKVFGHHRQRSGGKHHKQRSHQEYSRSRSFPNNLAAAAALAHGASDSPPDVAPLPSILRPQPIYPNRLPHANTEPLPPPQSKPKTPLPVPQLPRALVLSGLEHASDATQRSLARVLGEKKVVLETEGISNENDEDEVWNLPEGFITVYVCPWSARERPALHKALLDKFAMSANVFVPQDIRRDFHLLPFSSSASPAAPRPFYPNFVTHSNPGSPAPAYPTPLPPTTSSTTNVNQNNTPPTFTKSLPLHKRTSTHFTPSILPDEVIPWSFVKTLQDARKNRTHMSYNISLYLSDIFSATRHNSRLDAMLLTARSMKDAEDLVCAARVVGNDLTGMELVRMDGGAGGEDLESDEESEDQTSASVNESGDHISKEYVRLSEDRSVADAESVNSRSRSTSTTPVLPMLDVTEVHVARIVPRVISHRVRLRDSPQDEVLASAVFGATFNTPPSTLARAPDTELEGKQMDAQNTAEGDSVKAILVSILSEV